jgi:hypothetical protein
VLQNVRRIAHMPYHALTHAERDTYNARKRLLEHLGDILRTKAVERERMRLDDENSQDKEHIEPSFINILNVIYCTKHPQILATCLGELFLTTKV